MDKEKKTGTYVVDCPPGEITVRIGAETVTIGQGLDSISVDREFLWVLIEALKEGVE